MDLFNKTFFRFAAGFIGVLAVSVMCIIVINRFYEQGTTGGECVNCAVGN